MMWAVPVKLSWCGNTSGLGAAAAGSRNKLAISTASTNVAASAYAKAGVLSSAPALLVVVVFFSRHN